MPAQKAGIFAFIEAVFFYGSNTSSLTDCNAIPPSGYNRVHLMMVILSANIYPATFNDYARIFVSSGTRFFICRPLIFPYICFLSAMNETTTALTALFNRIPRRHSAENLKEISTILREYEGLLIQIEAMNPFYEKNIPVFFDNMEAVMAAIKRSADNKASKKNKDIFFDEASGALKDSIEALISLYAEGNRAD